MITAKNVPLIQLKTATFNGLVDFGDSGSSITLDWTQGGVGRLRLSANATIAFTPPPGVGHMNLRLETLGGFTASFTGVKWPNGTPPVVPTGAGTLFYISFLYDGTNIAGSYGSGAWS